MRHFDPAENDERIRAGLVAALSGKSLEFANENSDLIVVFDEPFTKYSKGRIVLFQEYMYNLTERVPEFIKEIPACIKVFFRLGIEEKDKINSVLTSLQTEDAKAVYRSLGISQLQFAGKIITPSP